MNAFMVLLSFSFRLTKYFSFFFFIHLICVVNIHSFAHSLLFLFSFSLFVHDTTHPILENPPSVSMDRHAYLVNAKHFRCAILFREKKPLFTLLACEKDNLNVCVYVFQKREKKKQPNLAFDVKQPI